MDVDLAYRAAVHTLYPDQPTLWSKWLPTMYTSSSHVVSGKAEGMVVVPNIRPTHTCYIHLDLDCFYAQVEGERLGVDNDNTPFVLQQWHNLIAVNYPARAYGIKRFHSIQEAREMCPNVQSTHVPTYSVAPFLHAIEAANNNNNQNSNTTTAATTFGGTENVGGGGTGAASSSSVPTGHEVMPKVIQMGVLPPSIVERGYPYQQSHYYNNPQRTTHKVSLDPYRAASRRIFGVLRSYNTVSTRPSPSSSSQPALLSQGSPPTDRGTTTTTTSSGSQSNHTSALLGVSKAGVDEAFLDATEAAGIEIDNLWWKWASIEEVSHSDILRPSTSSFDAEIAWINKSFHTEPHLLEVEVAAPPGDTKNTTTATTNIELRRLCAPIMNFMEYAQRHILAFTKLADGGVIKGSEERRKVEAAGEENTLGSVAMYEELWRWVGDFRHLHSLLTEPTSTTSSRLQLGCFFLHACMTTASLFGASIVSNAVRLQVKAKVGYNCSCGISLNRVIAKITSATFKPNQQTLLLPQNVLPYLSATKVQALRGFGGKLGSLLASVVMTRKRQSHQHTAGGAIEGSGNHHNDEEVDDERPLFDDSPTHEDDRPPATNGTTNDIHDDGGAEVDGGGDDPGGKLSATAASIEREARKSLTCGDCWFLDDYKEHFYGAFNGCEMDAVAAFLQLRGIVCGDIGEALPIGLSDDLRLSTSSSSSPTRTSRKHSLFAVPPLPAKSILANKVINKTSSTPTLVAWIQCLAVEVAQRLDGLATDYAELVMDLLQHHMRRRSLAVSGEHYPFDVRDEFAVRVDAKLGRISFNQSGYSPSTDYGSKTVHPPRRPAPSPPPPPHHSDDGSSSNTDDDSDKKVSVYEYELSLTSDYCRDAIIPFIVKAATLQIINQCGPPPNWKAALLAATTTPNTSSVPQHHQHAGIKRERCDGSSAQQHQQHPVTVKQEVGTSIPVKSCPLLALPTTNQQAPSAALGSVFIPTALKGKVTTLNIALAGLSVSLLRYRRGTGDHPPEVLCIDSGDCLVDIEKMMLVATDVKGGIIVGDRGGGGGQQRQQSTLAAAFSKAPIKATPLPHNQVSSDDDDEVEFIHCATSSGPKSPQRRPQTNVSEVVVASANRNKKPQPPTTTPTRVAPRSVMDLLGASTTRSPGGNKKPPQRPTTTATTMVVTISDDDDDDVVEL